MKKKKGTFLICIGLLLLAAALVLTGYNIWESEQAKISSDKAVAEMTKVIEEKYDEKKQEDEPLYEKVPDKEMPTILIDGQRYIGVLDIPDKGLSLAVLAGEWSYSKLRIAPCQYAGSVYKDNMVIAGHNYSSHFSKIKSLKPGSQVRFTDVEGNEFYYEVGWTDILEPTQVEDLENAEGWNLSLFTCTYDGGERCVIRCIRQR